MKVGMLIIGVIMLCGCDSLSEQASNKERVGFYKPEKLFEYDGVSVYCFSRGGDVIYFTNAKGNVEWNTSRISGKMTVVDKHQTIGTKTYIHERK